MFDRKPKLLRCLHNICEHCYYASKIKKDLLICPRCKDVSGGEVDSQADCVTMNEMVVQTLQDAFGETRLYSSDAVKCSSDGNGSKTNDAVKSELSSDGNDGSKTVDGKDTNLKMPCLNSDASCGITEEKRSSTTQMNAGENEAINSKSVQGIRWFDELFDNKSHALHSDFGEHSKTNATKEEPAYVDFFGDTQGKETLSQMDSQTNLNEEHIPNANCTIENDYHDSVIFPKTQVGLQPSSGNSIGRSEADGIQEMTKDIVCSTRHHLEAADCYCPDCHLFMCPQCQTKHADDMTSKYHRCYGTDVMRAIPLHEMESNTHCVLHPEYPLNYFCQHHACKKLACIKCATNLHIKHGKSSVEEAVALEKTNLNERLHEIEKILSNDTEGTSRSSDPHSDAGQDKIFQTLLEVTEKRKTELLNEVDRYYTNHDVIAAYLIELQYTKYYCDMALGYTTKSELLEVCHMIHAWAEELLKREIQLEKNPRETMIFVDETQMDIVREIEGLVSGLSIGNRRKRKRVKGKRRKPEESVC